MANSKVKGLGFPDAGRLNMFHVILLATGMLGEGVDPTYYIDSKWEDCLGDFPYELLRKGKISKNKHCV